MQVTAIGASPAKILSALLAPRFLIDGGLCLAVSAAAAAAADTARTSAAASTQAILVAIWRVTAEAMMRPVEVADRRGLRKRSVTT